MKVNAEVTVKGMDMVDKFTVMVITILGNGRMIRKMAKAKRSTSRQARSRRAFGIMESSGVDIKKKIIL